MIYYHLVHPTLSRSIDRSIMQHARQWKDSRISNLIEFQNKIRAVFCVDEQTEPYKFRFAAGPNVLLPRNEQRGKTKRFSAANFRWKETSKTWTEYGCMAPTRRFSAQCFSESSGETQTIYGILFQIKIIHYTCKVFPIQQFWRYFGGRGRGVRPSVKCYL